MRECQNFLQWVVDQESKTPAAPTATPSTAESYCQFKRTVKGLTKLLDDLIKAAQAYEDAQELGMYLMHMRYLPQVPHGPTPVAQLSLLLAAAEEQHTKT